MSNSRTIKEPGIDCPRCGLPTRTKEHERITAKELRKPFYYRRWFVCDNRHCRTTTIMLEEHKVFQSTTKSAPTPTQVSPPLATPLPIWEGRIPTRKIGDFMEWWRMGGDRIWSDPTPVIWD